MNEAETRAEHIDPALRAAGWGVVEGSRIHREYPIAPGRLEGLGRRSKPLFADYILVYRNTKLAVLEAKAWDESLTEGLGQAKDYADKLAMTVDRLNDHVRRATGVTAGHLIRQRVLTEAKRQLVFTNQPIHEIAYDLTFADPSHFTRFFRKQTGTAPQAFREKGGG